MEEMAEANASNPSLYSVRSFGFQSDGALRRRQDFAEDLSGMVATGSVPPQAQQPAIAQTSTPKLALEREKLDEMLGKLMVFAQNQPNGWERAARWVEAKLTGDDRLYAEEKLRMQQMAMQAQEQIPESEDEATDLINEEDSRAFA